MNIEVLMRAELLLGVSLDIVVLLGIVVVSFVKE
jgi:hypothetical protein